MRNTNARNYLWPCAIATLVAVFSAARADDATPPAPPPEAGAQQDAGLPIAAPPTASAAAEAPAAEPAPPPDARPAPAPPAADSILLSHETEEELAAFTGQLLRVVAALGVVIGLVYLSLRLLGARFGAHVSRPGDLVRVLEAKRLDAKTTLYLVEVAGKATLIGVSEHEVRSLAPLAIDDAEIRAALALRDGPRDRKAFARVLAAKLDDRKET
jgi:flagellar biogenesis protein FliO